ncbi:hypothetical protein TVAG_314810 [Trichomonas vaginalis G3]|uniref:Uncharacterized protein n=1 Tax=Trichomonas vaginalis (strain ATCC PRA-98 / G3) TaxID=412133 RepID=A2ETS0_TRIV3|nr:hypothetical protein TVAGG3_0046000 [Trichomonas vaginalis G3]EAY03951.1 hypothetical protein TVAG_314810 [Trichomonas vaginalis G3]KAI5541029.1 hypothetical protein TVAGG3_0046000 [Trichomonas vaginalis G3]|eukprot:XP_001316174.1 hypothetical protein [Trichomonas vaginalis G3]
MSFENIPPISDFKVQRGCGAEAKRVALRLKDFNYETSDIWKVLKLKFSSGITHSELKSIAGICSFMLGIKLDRDASRDNRVLIKWFDENWDKIKTIIDKVHLRDEKEQIINHEREIRENSLK